MTLEFTPAGFDAFQNNITEVSTVRIGTALSTGTANQALQVGTATTQLGAYISGNLGIGTTNPSAKLTVQGDTNINNTLPTTVSYASSFRVASQETEPREVFFSNDGKTMYVLGNSGDDITWYTLSTPWSITSASHVSQFSVAGQLTVPSGFYFKPDGTKFYVTGTTGVGAAATAVNQYSCRTPWDLTTASYDSVAYSVIAQDTLPQAVEFKPDGTRMYIVGDFNNVIFQYSLSTSWDLSTVSYGSSFSVASQETTAEGIRFSLDGTKLLLTGSNGDDINYYTLSTPWDISTLSFVGIITTVGAATTLGETNPSGLYWKPDGTKLYLSGYQIDTIYEFNMTSNADLEVTGKTSLYGNLDVYENTTAYGELSAYQNAYFYNRVGIGTTNPATLLHLQSTDPTIRLRRSDASTNAYGEVTSDTSGFITIKSDPGNAAANSGFSFTVDNVEAVRVSAAGSVGIGTATVPDKLNVFGRVQIQQDSSSTNRLIFRGQPSSPHRWNIDNNGASNSFRIFREDDATTANGFIAVSISTTGLLNAYSLGIGTISPSTTGNVTTVNASQGSFSVVTLSSSAGVATVNITSPTSGQKLEMYVLSPSAAGSRAVNFQVGGTLIPAAGISSGSVVTNGGTWPAGANYLVSLTFVGGSAAANAYGVIG